MFKICYELKTFVFQMLEILNPSYYSGHNKYLILKAFSNMNPIEDTLKLMRDGIKYKPDIFFDYASSVKTTLGRGYGDCDDMAYAVISLYGVLIGDGKKVYTYDALYCLEGSYSGHMICIYKDVDGKALVFDNLNLIRVDNFDKFIAEYMRKHSYHKYTRMFKMRWK